MVILMYVYHVASLMFLPWSRTHLTRNYRHRWCRSNLCGQEGTYFGHYSMLLLYSLAKSHILSEKIHIAHSPVLTFFSQNFLLFMNVLTSYHFNHLHIREFLSFFVLKSQLLSFFEQIFVCAFLRTTRFSLESVNIRVKVSVQFGILSFSSVNRSLFFIFISFWIFNHKMFLALSSVRLYIALMQMGFFFVDCILCIWCFLHEIVDSRSVDIFFVFFVYSDWTGSWLSSLHKHWSTLYDPGRTDLTS